MQKNKQTRYPPPTPLPQVFWILQNKFVFVLCSVRYFLCLLKWVLHLQTHAHTIRYQELALPSHMSRVKSGRDGWPASNALLWRNVWHKEEKWGFKAVYQLFDLSTLTSPSSQHPSLCEIHSQVNSAQSGEVLWGFKSPVGVLKGHWLEYKGQRMEGCSM